MPTVFTHAVVGGLAAAAVGDRGSRRRLCAAATVVSVLPDLDVIGFTFGVEYGDFLGHRGFFHSPFFGLIVALFVVLVWFREHRPFSGRWWAYVTFLFIVGASHGVLDAFTDGGLGIALLSPVSNHRYFMPWTPIPVAPIGVVDFISPYGLKVITFEAIHIWLPAAVAAGAVIVVRRIRRRGDLTIGRGAE